MNVVDSSAWLEFFADGPNARRFDPAIEDSANLAVPSICVAEVFRRMMAQRGIEAAMRATAAMQRQGTVIELFYWNGDRLRFVMVQGESLRPTRLHLVVNWLEELRRRVPGGS